MKKILAFIMILSMSLGSLCGCSFLGSESSSVDVDAILENQKIIFVMNCTLYNDENAWGYFIDNEGKKHIYTEKDGVPKDSEENTYKYLLEHFEDFEGEEFWSENTLSKMIKYLYCVDEKAELIKGNDVAFDGPCETLRGIRLNEENLSIITIEGGGSNPESLDDKYAEKIIEEFGEDWDVVE